MDVLVAHPHKHHVLHLISGCVQSGADVAAALPLYRTGLGAVLARIPGSMGRKAAGYFYSGIPKSAIISPLRWQLSKLLSQYRGEVLHVSSFDAWVAEKLRSKQWRPKVFVGLQDYLPRSIGAAQEAGATIVSDQILNQSDEASARIAKHYLSLGLPWCDTHDESINSRILSHAAQVTVPSRYCLNGIKERVPASASLHIIPYGVDPRRFEVDRKPPSSVIRLVARANSVRKGGHLLLRALQQAGPALLRLTGGLPIEVIVLGQFETALVPLYQSLRLPTGLSISASNIPHLDVPRLLARSQLFVMPSLSEGLSPACQEAMLARLPIVATEYCGIDDLENGVTGYITDDTPETLAHYLTEAFRRIDEWATWGANAHRLASAYSWDDYENRYAQLIQTTIAKAA